MRLAARLLDPDAYVICAAALKTHNAVVATLSVKNMTLGAPLRSGPKESARWSDKRRYHVGIRQMHYNIMLTAQRMRPFWGATVIDGFEGMEGNGPSSGLPVPRGWRSPPPTTWPPTGWASSAWGSTLPGSATSATASSMGVGRYDLAGIDVRGERRSPK